MKRSERRLLVAAVCTMVAAPLAAQTPETHDDRTRPRIDVRFGDRPSFRFGSALRLDVTAKVQGDLHHLDHVDSSDEEGFDLARRRIGVSGVLWKRVQFEVERELGASRPWRDAFVDVAFARAVQVRAGQFKMPFSLDQLTSSAELDFVYRSRLADLLAPGRGVGGSVHGRLARRAIGYDAGVFRRDADNAGFGTNPGAGSTLAGRVTIRPFRLAGTAGALKTFEVGASATAGDVPEGRYSLRGRLTSRLEFFSPVFVNGRRTRVGSDVNWTTGRLDLRAEWARVRDERIDQGLFGQTLPTVDAAAWYVTGVWHVAGPSRSPAQSDARRFWIVGPLDVAMRFERLQFGSLASDEPALRNPRAAHLLSVASSVATAGVTWQLTRWARLQLNAIREQLSDPVRSPVLGRTVFWTEVARLQFAM